MKQGVVLIRERNIIVHDEKWNDDTRLWERYEKALTGLSTTMTRQCILYDEDKESGYGYDIFIPEYKDWIFFFPDDFDRFCLPVTEWEEYFNR